MLIRKTDAFALASSSSCSFSSPYWCLRCHNAHNLSVRVRRLSIEKFYRRRYNFCGCSGHCWRAGPRPLWIRSFLFLPFPPFVARDRSLADAAGGETCAPVPTILPLFFLSLPNFFFLLLLPGQYIRAWNGHPFAFSPSHHPSAAL